MPSIVGYHRYHPPSNIYLSLLCLDVMETKTHNPRTLYKCTPDGMSIVFNLCNTGFLFQHTVMSAVIDFV